jgi:AcrR family transcriptional regulator
MAKPGPRPRKAAGEDGGGSGDELRTRLIDGAIRVLARDGFAHTSARAVAAEAGTVNGSVFYYFGSMDGLLAAATRAIGERGRERIRQGLGGSRAHLEWPRRLSTVMQAEVDSDEGRAVMELFVGSRTSPALAAEVRTAIDEAIAYATAEMQTVIGDALISQLVPVPLIAELAAAAFLGIEVLAQNGRPIDVDQLAAGLATALRLLGAPTDPADPAAEAETATPTDPV